MNPFSFPSPRQSLLVLAFGALSLAHSLRAAEPAGAKHCLWRVTNAKAPFYLLGSIHSLRSRDYTLPPIIHQAIDESRQYWFEVDPRFSEAFAKKFKAAAHYPKGVHLKDKVRPETYAYLNKITRGGWGALQDVKPWAIAEFGLRHPGYVGYDYDYGVDEHVYEIAKMRGRPVGGIETIDEHIRVLADMEDIESEVFLLQALVYSDQDVKEVPQEVAAWKSGDTDRLYALCEPRIKEAPTVWWRLLDRRNARWIPRIESQIKSGVPTMIVAGALHFSGPHSVINMLRAHGYKVEQL